MGPIDAAAKAVILEKYTEILKKNCSMNAYKDFRESIASQIFTAGSSSVDILEAIKDAVRRR